MSGLAFSPTFGRLSGGNNPTKWPGSAFLEAWYHWRYDRQYSSTLYTTGGGPAVTFTGSVPINCGLQVEVHTTGGARGTALFRWSSDNGATWSADILTAATVNLGNGITLAFAVGTYVIGHVYKLVVSSWRDQTGHGHHWVSIDGTLGKLPVPKVKAAGTFLGFDGSANMMKCADTLATLMVGGTDKAFYIVGVCYIENVSPAVNGALIFFGDSVTAHSYIWYITNAPQFRAGKQDDGGVTVTVSGGVPDTNLHIYELICDGVSAEMRVDGVTVATGVQNLANPLTVNIATLGKTYNSGAEGNPLQVAWGELALYRDDLDATTRDDIVSRMRVPYGI